MLTVSSVIAKHLMINPFRTMLSRRPFLNFYAHIVMGLVCDLGINNPIPTEHSTMQAFKCAVGFKQNIPTSRTMEERRAALGCFLITSRYVRTRVYPVIA